MGDTSLRNTMSAGDGNEPIAAVAQRLHQNNLIRQVSARTSGWQGWQATATARAMSERVQVYRVARLVESNNTHTHINSYTHIRTGLAPHHASARNRKKTRWIVRRIPLFCDFPVGIRVSSPLSGGRLRLLHCPIHLMVLPYNVWVVCVVTH